MLAAGSFFNSLNRFGPGSPRPDRDDGVALEGGVAVVTERTCTVRFLGSRPFQRKGQSIGDVQGIPRRPRHVSNGLPLYSLWTPAATKPMPAFVRASAVVFTALCFNR